MPDDTFTVTPYVVEGTVDYDRLLEQFGANHLEPAQKAQFPDHPLIRRDVFYRLSRRMLRGLTPGLKPTLRDTNN